MTIARRRRCTWRIVATSRLCPYAVSIFVARSNLQLVSVRRATLPVSSTRRATSTAVVLSPLLRSFRLGFCLGDTFWNRHWPCLRFPNHARLFIDDLLALLSGFIQRLVCHEADESIPPRLPVLITNRCIKLLDLSKRSKVIENHLRWRIFEASDEQLPLAVVGDCQNTTFHLVPMRENFVPGCNSFAT